MNKGHLIICQSKVSQRNVDIYQDSNICHDAKFSQAVNIYQNID